MKKTTIGDYILYYISWLLAILCILVSIFLFISEVVSGETINLNEYLNSSTYDDSYFPFNKRVSVEIKECYGCFYNQYIYHYRRYFPYHEMKYFFVVKLDDGSIIAVETNSWKVKKFDELTDATLNSRPRLYVKHEGIVGGLHHSEYDLEEKYKEYVDGLISKKILPDNINVRFMKIGNVGSKIEETVTSIGILLLGIVLILILRARYLTPLQNCYI